MLDAKLDDVIVTAANVVGAPAAFLSASNSSVRTESSKDLLVVRRNTYLNLVDDAVVLIKVPVIP